MSFSEAQKRAIRHKDGPALVLAGPGSGKTTVITNRVRYLTEKYGVQAGSILVITFTRAAAREMKERYEKMTGQGSRVAFGTFHSVFFLILKLAYGYQASNIVREEQRIRFIREQAERMQLDLEDPANEAPINKPGFLELGVSPENAPDKATYVTIHFEKGVPTSVNGEEMDAEKVIEVLNKVGGENGCGLLDIVENRLVGMKSRGVYETPGGAILYKAHEKLEEITLDKETQHYKQQLALKFAELVYNGQWYTPLRKAMSAFVDSTQETVTGDVKLKLYKGNIIPASVTSPYSLYSAGMATFDEDDCYDQADSAGFINLFGLPIKVRALNDEVLAAKTGEHFPGVE